MIPRLILIVLMMPVLVSAQRGGGGGGGGGGGSAPPPTPFEEFVDRLKIHQKEQLPAVQRIFGETDAEARGVAQELTQLRLRMLNLELTGSSSGVEPVVTAFAAAAAKMTAIEVVALSRVSAELKSNQLSKRGEAFDVIGGIFYPPPPPPPARPRRGGPPVGGGVR